MDLTFKNLEKYFNLALSSGADYVGVQVEMEGFAEPEIIINGKANIADKLKYYEKTYDAELNHKFAKGIRITGFAFADSLDEIENYLFTFND
ncbi:hypothetical protein ICW_05664 [Bacillus wiedmannii]|uniref:hypothetical protein n=1 Tax=Bacillus wiedmannii TaxID=1890302 RepID=UPI00027AB89F|nr:hypothetical protein [Bacillus wiedmannii]EJS63001.1 hypothetical protein ICW_05664 [Bacillus wiedmannii]